MGPRRAFTDLQAGRYFHPRRPLARRVIVVTVIVLIVRGVLERPKLAPISRRELKTDPQEADIRTDTKRVMKDWNWVVTESV